MIGTMIWVKRAILFTPPKMMKAVRMVTNTPMPIGLIPNEYRKAFVMVFVCTALKIKPKLRITEKAKILLGHFSPNCFCI